MNTGYSQLWMSGLFCQSGTSSLTWVTSCFFHLQLSETGGVKFNTDDTKLKTFEHSLCRSHFFFIFTCRTAAHDDRRTWGLAVHAQGRAEGRGGSDWRVAPLKDRLKRGKNTVGKVEETDGKPHQKDPVVCGHRFRLVTKGLPEKKNPEQLGCGVWSKFQSRHRLSGVVELSSLIHKCKDYCFK